MTFKTFLEAVEPFVTQELLKAIHKYNKGDWVITVANRSLVKVVGQEDDDTYFLIIYTNNNNYNCYLYHGKHLPYNLPLIGIEKQANLLNHKELNNPDEVARFIKQEAENKPNFDTNDIKTSYMITWQNDKRNTNREESNKVTSRYINIMLQEFGQLRWWKKTYGNTLLFTTSNIDLPDIQQKVNVASNTWLDGMKFTVTKLGNNGGDDDHRRGGDDLPLNPKPRHGKYLAV